MGNRTGMVVEKNEIVYSEGQSTRVVRIYENGIIQYQLYNEAPPSKPYTLINASRLIPLVNTTLIPVDENKTVIDTGDFVLRVEEDPIRFTVKTSKGKVVVSELSDDTNVRGEWLSRPSGVYETKEGPRCRVNFELDPKAGYFGLGEKFLSLDRKGQRITLWNENPYGSGSEKAYKNIPFLICTNGYGLLLNSSTRSVWDIGFSSLFSLSIEIEEPSLDLFILTGDSLKNILGKYAELTGKAPLPPRWSFGLWVSPYGDYLADGGNWRQQELLDFARNLRARGIPGDVIHLDPFWMGKKKGLCDFQWDLEDFPDPKSFIKELKDLGFSLCLWEHPYVEKGSPLYQEGAQKGYFLRKSDGSVYDCNLVIIPPEKRNESNYQESFYAPGGIVDFTNPEAREWYKQLHRPLLEMGVDTFKTDFGEVIPEDAVFHNGKTGKEMRNLYALLYNATVFEVLKEYKSSPVLWGRSGYAGIQKYPVQWSGDPYSNFRSLVTTIRGGLSYGLSGVPFWSFDMGGFKGKPTLEAYIRWMQTGLFLSHSRIHGTDSRMPWSYGERAETILKKYIDLRYSLLPYIYATAYEATQSGIPVIRPLFLEFEKDPFSYQFETEYLLGSSLLVVPILNEEGDADIYFPPGAWYDWFTGTKVQGPSFQHRMVELETLPLFARQGAIIPMALPSQTVPDFWDPLILTLFGETSEPEGEGSVCRIPEERAGGPTDIQYCRKSSASVLEISGPERRYTIRLVDFEGLSRIQVNGIPHPVTRGEMPNTFQLELKGGSFSLTIPADSTRHETDRWSGKNPFEGGIV